MKDKSQNRVYQKESCIVFRKTHDKFGELSNMVAGFSLNINGVLIKTSEALYQACRYPSFPEIQKIIISQNSPMTAKMKSKAYRNKTRKDWNEVRVRIMKWCIRVKLAQNWTKFGSVLESTLEYPIVEESRKDDFWGAKPIDENTLIGMNVLGRSLMELRDEYFKFKDRFNYILNPPSIDNFYFLGNKVKTIYTKQDEIKSINEHNIRNVQMNIFHKY